MSYLVVYPGLFFCEKSETWKKRGGKKNPPAEARCSDLFSLT
jgi:hypothetical protein